jgi:hypothetical protein
MEPTTELTTVFALRLGFDLGPDELAWARAELATDRPEQEPAPLFDLGRICRVPYGRGLSKNKAPPSRPGPGRSALEHLQLP